MTRLFHLRPVTALLAALLSFPLGAFAQASGAGPDTVALTLPAAEAQFVTRNLSLLAQRYNVSAAQAQVVQARLFPNPTLYLEQSAYRPRHGEQRAAVLPVGYNGQNVVVVQQLIQLAGKRRAAGEVAQRLADAEQFNFEDLVRTLRYQLRAAFRTLYYDQAALALYDREIGSFAQTVAAYNDQLARGNVALKEVVRLRAFLTQLQSERQALRADAADQQTTLHTLLADGGAFGYRPVPDGTPIGGADSNRLESLTLSQLIDSAQANRPDLRARQTQQQAAEANLRLQHKLAVPDLTLGYTYDRQGSYIRNYNAVSVGLPLPLFNRNQGGIRIAQAQQQGAAALVQQQQTTVQTEVSQTWRKALDADRLFRTTDPTVAADFDRLQAAVTQQYNRRNLSQVEYLDFLESYKNSLLQRNQLQRDRADALDQLELATGSHLF